MRIEDYALKSNARAFASRSKAKAKPQRRTSASSSTKTILIRERTWTDIEPQDYSLKDGERTWTDIQPEDYSPIAYPVSKQLRTLLRHGSLPREDDGAIEFSRLKDYLQNHFVYSQHCLMKSGRAAWQEEEITRKDFSIVLMLRVKFFTSEIFKVIQDAILWNLHYRTMS